MKSLFFSFIICLIFQACHSANIVAYIPSPFYSHQSAFKQFWLELARRGHQITLIQPDIIIENNENITHVVLNGTYRILKKHKVMEQMKNGENLVKVVYTGIKTFEEAMEYQLGHPAVHELLKGEKQVDLFFSEFQSLIGFALGSKLRAPMIGLVSMDAGINAHTALGNPTHPVLYPDRDMGSSTVPTFMERVQNTVFWLFFKFTETVVFNPLQIRIIEKCLDEKGPIDKFLKNISLLFVNANPLLYSDRPLGPRTINVGGGFHLSKPKPLPESLKDYLDNAEDGVIYFSLGSTVASKELSKEAKKVITETFSNLQYKILWKYEEQLTEQPNNIKIMKWLPQQDVLSHKNIKLFITQGGVQSMEEALINYVPMIVLPIFGDQYNNAKKIVDRGFGLMIDHNNLDVETFKGAILEVINNPKYRQRTKELVDLVMDQPMTGIERAIWWTEYTLRHGHIKPLSYSADTPWYQYFLLDVIFIFVLGTIIIVYGFVKSLKLMKLFYINLIKKKKIKYY